MYDVIRHEEAVNDIIEQAIYIGSDNPDAAGRFLDEAEKAIALLAEMPQIGSMYDSRNPQTDALRLWHIHGFEKHIIFYRAEEESIEIVRVLHALRDIAAML